MTTLRTMSDETRDAFLTEVLSSLHKKHKKTSDDELFTNKEVLVIAKYVYPDFAGKGKTLVGGAPNFVLKLLNKFIADNDDLVALNALNRIKAFKDFVGSLPAYDDDGTQSDGDEPKTKKDFVAVFQHQNSQEMGDTFLEAEDEEAEATEKLNELKQQMKVLVKQKRDAHIRKVALETAFKNKEKEKWDALTKQKLTALASSSKSKSKPESDYSDDDSDSDDSDVRPSKKRPSSSPTSSVPTKKVKFSLPDYIKSELSAKLIDYLRDKDAISDDYDTNVPLAINKKVKKHFSASQIAILTTHGVFKEDDE
jgi:hypothetical protein